MNYLRAKGYNFNHDEGPGWKKPALLVVAVVSLYLYGSAIFVDLFSFVTYPLLRLSGSISGSFADSLKTQKQLIADNKRLSNENERLRVQSTEADELRTENEKLRGFRAGSLSVKDPVYSRVLTKPTQLPYDELIIDTGSDRDPKLKVGQLVFADPETVLGHVVEVGKKFSRVELYSEGGVSLPVSVGPDGNPSVALGLGAGNFSLSLPRGLNVKIGDPIRTSIIGDYLLGYAGKIDKDPNDPFQKIHFRSPYNVFDLEWVFVSYE